MKVSDTSKRIFKNSKSKQKTETRVQQKLAPELDQKNVAFNALIRLAPRESYSEETSAKESSDKESSSGSEDSSS